MFCPHCGMEISDVADVCLCCGRSVENIKKQINQDSASFGWWWLGFFFPLIGIILWAVWTSSCPKKAARSGWGAIIGIITSFVLTALIVGIYLLLFGLLLSKAMYF